MLNIGPLELMVILVIALLVVGPRRLPEVGRSIGRGIREFRKAQDEVQKTIQSALNEPAPTARPVPRADAAPRPPIGPKGRRSPATSARGLPSSAKPRTRSSAACAWTWTTRTTAAGPRRGRPILLDRR